MFAILLFRAGARAVGHSAIKSAIMLGFQTGFFPLFK